MTYTLGNVKVDDRVYVKVADARERLLTVASRREIYLQDLGRVGIDFADRTALHIAGFAGTELVAAIRLIGPSPLPLEMFRFVGSPPLENRALQAGGFWVRRDFRRLRARSGELFRLLYAKLLEVATRHSAAAIYLRTPSRPVAELYRAVGFLRLQSLDFLDPEWGPVYTMWLPLHDRVCNEPTAALSGGAPRKAATPVIDARARK
ncbi:MAG: hypothetical protein N3C12_01165 [Candidatus Binatia bacterium]|nr:hypothetical protein [Candidatus Binatia bacterium]